MSASPARVVAAIAVTLAASTGCVDGSGFRYLANRDVGAFVKLPEEWRVFEGEPVEAALGTAGSDASAWSVTFDASPHPKLERFFEFDTDSPHPSGLVQVIHLTPAQRDQVSFHAVRNLLLPVDSGVEEGSVTDVEVRDVEQDDGVRGQRVRFTVVGEDGDRYRIDQTGLLDDDNRTIYLFAVGCETRCFERNEDVIDTIAESWRVRRS